MTIVFKATEPSTETNQIVVSFSSRWMAPLCSQSIEYVFRKRIPKSLNPHTMFIYLGSPVCQIIGKTKIISSGSINLQKALSVQDKAKITEDELIKYFSGDKEIGFYHVGKIDLFERPILLKELKSELNFFTPQSFVHVSKKALDWLEKHV